MSVGKKNFKILLILKITYSILQESAFLESLSVTNPYPLELPFFSLIT